MSAGRNDPCPCGSGKKFKKCCLPREEVDAVLDSGWIRIRRTEGELTLKLGPHTAHYYGPHALDEAWDEYTLWPDAPAIRNEWLEYETSFQAWMMFDWEPEPTGDSESEDRPTLSPARHCAELKGKSLDSYEHRYIDTACSAPFTFYLIVSTVPGREIVLRDIFLQNPVTVRERQASTTLRPGQIIFTKVVAMDGAAVMFGCAPYAIPGQHFDAIVELRERLARNGDLSPMTLRDYDTELRRLYLDLREAILDPAPPILQNTDGDDIQLTRIDYELDCRPKEALEALLPLSFEKDLDAFADDSEYDKSGELVSVEIPWLRPRKDQTLDGPFTLLGQIEILPGKMRVNVNSLERAETIKAEIASRLGERARKRGIVIDSIEHRVSHGAKGELEEFDLDWEQRSEAMMQKPEVQALMAKMNAEHWRTWPDIPLPALGGLTPRAAAATPAGREKLDVLLLDFEAHEDRPGNMSPDIEALRRELGI